MAAIILAALAVGGGVYALAMPYLSDERKSTKRLANVAQGSRKIRAGLALQQQPLQMRKKQVQDSLKELEAKQKAKKRVTLRQKLVRAGLDITPRTFYLVCVFTGLLGAILVLVTGSSLLVSTLVGFVSGVGLPRWWLAKRTKKRQEKFLREFANAIEIIVRGVKSGLPLNDCLQIIATEAPEPVKTEFINLVEQQKVGMPLQGSFERMYDRMPLQEVSFFAVVIAIQAQTGGNLAEALGNLAQVLRDRYRLQAKVKSYSAEAKASAMILGALPPALLFFVYLVNPDYISTLFTEELGNLLLIASGVWMLIGIIVMRKMINFDY